MELGLMLGIFSGLLHLFAFGVYNKQVFEGTSRPNTTTWTLWVFIATLNCITYLAMSGDWIKGIITIAGSSACFVTLAFSFFRGRLTRLNKLDFIILMVGLVAIFVWWTHRSVTCANLLLQACFAISFVPTFLGMMKNVNIEKSLPWFMWTGAYIIATIVVLLRWNGQYQDLVFPALGAFAHGGVGILALRKNKKGDGDKNVI